MDIIGGLSRLFGAPSDTPTPRRQELDAATQGLINQQFDQAKRSPSEFAADLNKGIESSVSRLGGLGASDFGTTGVNPGMREALRNAYSGQTGEAIDRIKLNNQIMGEQRKGNALKLASQYALQQQSAQTNYFQALTDAYNQMEAQRAALVSAISGVANTAMGMYMGSRSKAIGNGNTSPDQTIRAQETIMVPAMPETSSSGYGRMMAPESYGGGY
jgi:hypothetical protein